jgi:hypothetical protein
MWSVNFAAAPRMITRVTEDSPKINFRSSMGFLLQIENYYWSGLPIEI